MNGYDQMEDVKKKEQEKFDTVNSDSRGTSAVKRNPTLSERIRESLRAHYLGNCEQCVAEAEGLKKRAAGLTVLNRADREVPYRVAKCETETALRLSLSRALASEQGSLFR